MSIAVMARNLKGVKDMLKQRVLIKHSSTEFLGEEGIIVAVRSVTGSSMNYHQNTDGIACKVLVGDKLSNWIPFDFLEVIQAYSTPA